jgi:hypothetical protein
MQYSYTHKHVEVMAKSGEDAPCESIAEGHKPNWKRRHVPSTAAQQHLELQTQFHGNINFKIVTYSFVIRMRKSEYYADESVPKIRVEFELWKQAWLCGYVGGIGQFVVWMWL